MQTVFFKLSHGLRATGSVGGTMWSHVAWPRCSDAIRRGYWHVEEEHQEDVRKERHNLCCCVPVSFSSSDQRVFQAVELKARTTVVGFWNKIGLAVETSRSFVGVGCGHEIWMKMCKPLGFARWQSGSDEHRRCWRLCERHHRVSSASWVGQHHSARGGRRLCPDRQGTQEDRGFGSQAVCWWCPAALQQLGCLVGIEHSLTILTGRLGGLEVNWLDS